MNPVPLQIGVIVVLVAFFGMYVGVRSSKFLDLNTRNAAMMIRRSVRALGVILGGSLMAAYSMNWGWTDPHAFVFAGLAFAIVVQVVIREHRQIRRGVQRLQNA